MNLPGTSGGTQPRTNFRRTQPGQAQAATGVQLPADIALGNRIQDDAIDRVENERRARLNSLAGMGREQGQAAQADYQALAERMFGSPGQVAARQAQVAQQLTGAAGPWQAGGSPLDQRLAATGARQVGAAAQQGGLAVAQANEAAAIQKLLNQIGNSQADRGRTFDNRTNLNNAANAEDNFNAMGEKSLGELLRQIGLGKRQASITAGAGQAERTQMQLAADRERDMYERQIAMQQEALAVQQEQDAATLAQIDQFLASIRR